LTLDRDREPVQERTGPPAVAVGDAALIGAQAPLKQPDQRQLVLGAEAGEVGGSE